jgi:hypothetical protein
MLLGFLLLLAKLAYWKYLPTRRHAAGLSEWAVHPGLGNQESQALDPGGWRVRHTDYEFLASSAARDLLQREGIVTIDYSAIQQVWRQAGRPR